MTYYLTKLFNDYYIINFKLFIPFNISNADFYGIKKIKSIKSIVGISPTMVLLFHLPCFYLNEILKDVKINNSKFALDIECKILFISL
jgi:hypothetical protein